jgi:hypothetical protein
MSILYRTTSLLLLSQFLKTAVLSHNYYPKWKHVFSKPVIRLAVKPQKSLTSARQ